MKRSRTPRRLIWGLAMLTASAAVRAGVAPQPVSRPFVFPDAAVNVVVLPYSATDRAGAAIGSTGQRLSLLIQLNTLFSLLKYRSVGTVPLFVEPGKEKDGQPEAVVSKLLGLTDGAAQRLQPDHGLILIWGQIYEENQEIFLQSYLRFLRRGRSEDLSIPISNRRLVGRVSHQSFAFAPHKLTLGDLRDIEKEFQVASRVASSPGASGGQSLLEPGSAGVGYSVRRTQGDWMEIVSSGGGPNGWIHARISVGEHPLDRLMPELDFVDGLAGYLSFRFDDKSGNAERLQGTRANASTAFRRYEELAGAKAPPIPRAVWKQLLGILDLSGPVSEAPAGELFDDASRLLPSSSEARNLDIANRIRAAFAAHDSTFRPRQTVDALIDAIALNPKDLDVLSNLVSVYELLQAAPDFGSPDDRLPADELKQRLAKTRAVVREVCRSLIAPVDPKRQKARSEAFEVDRQHCRDFM